MRGITYFRFLIVSLLSALALSSVFYFCLKFLTESSLYSHRQTFAIALANEFEGRPYPQAVLNYDLTHQGPRGIRSQIWIVDATGKVLASSTTEPLPVDWLDINKPEAAHEFTVISPFVGSGPEVTVVRLQTKDSHYLVWRTSGRRQSTRFLIIPLILTFAMISTAVFLALTFTSFYLQRKSREAKAVLARLAKGDLKARFKIQRFDEIGKLMLDFNQMVAEIERLIHRVIETETARKNLLQELSHDIRTPLTGLRTSIETLRLHDGKMSADDRDEFFGIVEGELQYFIRLVEDLFFIADLGEPRYKATTSKIDLFELISTEIKSRQIKGGRVQWSLVEPERNKSCITYGDSHLVLRLIKNALDNAGKYAKEKVVVRLSEDSNNWRVEIDDDGLGISAADIQSFGRRRVHRIKTPQVGLYSLGLGSVIMNAIANMHNGSVQIQNLSSVQQMPSLHGTRLTILLPRETI